MADIIRLLSDSVANQIAAGEVIQRPASVIKELVENAIDAQSTKIIINIKDAGRTLIQVSDNGKGMSPTDARMAFERHATSKIHKADDLFSIKTMGFRGEALASIASVADVELKTCLHTDQLGTFIHIAGSEILACDTIATSAGTSFIVKNLFYNVPARRKFLKTNSTEFKHILNEIQRVALANPHIAFVVYNNDSIVYDLPQTNFRKRIVSIFGGNINQSLVPIQNETSLAKINGFIGQPKFARKTFGEQFFFVNGRYMRHPFFHKAIIQAYDKILPHDMIPSYFINFEVDPQSIDINIHPTKTEIKFENESSMWQLLNAATREGLGKFNVAPSIDFDQQGSIDIPIAPKSFEGLKAPSISVDPNYNPFDQKQKYTQNQQYQPEYTDLLYGNTAHNFDMQNDEIVIQSGITNSNNDIPAEQGRNFLLLKNKYILTPVKSGLMVIDQHRAHQRILYEQFMITLTNEDKVCQQLLFPQSIELNKSDSVIMNTILPELNIIGFDIHEFGPDTYIINGIPAFIDDSDATQIIEKILEDFKTGVPDLKEQAREKLAIGLAKASAIRYGHQLKPDEAGALIDNLFACQTPNYSPTGKPIIEIIQIDEIEKKMR